MRQHLVPSPRVTPPARTPGVFRRPRLALALLAFGQAIISIDFNIVYVALPHIGRDLDLADHSLQWVVSAYAIAFGGGLLLGGRAADVLGARPTFAVGMLVYAGSSVVGGLATTGSVLLAGRVVQGFGGALLFPSVITLVSSGFAQGRDRDRAFAVWGTAGGAGMLLGSLLGGVLTDAFGWQAVFYVVVPCAVLAACLAAPLLTGLAEPVPEIGRRSFDALGAATSTGAVSLLVLSLVRGPESGWLEPTVMVTFALAAALTVGFVAIERNHVDPLVPGAMLRDRDLRTGALVTFGFMATFGTLLYFLTMFFQAVRGYDAWQTGLAFLVPMGAVVAGSQASSPLSQRVGTRSALVGGLLLGAAGLVVLARALDPGATYGRLVPALVLVGIGQGAAYTLMFSSAVRGIAAAGQGIASGIVSTTQQIGGAVGLAVLVAVFNQRAPETAGSSAPAEIADGVRSALLVAAVGAALTAAVALGFTRSSHRVRGDERSGHARATAAASRGAS